MARREPILARPIGIAGRAVKWARRRPLVAALSVGMLLVAMVGMAGVVWQWRSAERQRALAEAACEEATDKAAAEVQGA